MTKQEEYEITKIDTYAEIFLEYKNDMVNSHRLIERIKQSTEKLLNIGDININDFDIVYARSQQCV